MKKAHLNEGFEPELAALVDRSANHFAMTG